MRLLLLLTVLSFMKAAFTQELSLDSIIEPSYNDSIWKWRTKQELQMDTAVVESRSFNNDAFHRYRQDKEFQYENFQRPPLRLWERFWRWFWGKINAILSTRSGRRTVNTIFVVIAIAVLVFFVWKVIGMNKERMFARGGGEGLDYTISTDDINSISFEEAIRDAVDAGNYRLAIRLLYLQSLKKLSDRGFIDWKINKTNSDYLKEVSGNKWSSLFSSLTYNFDYIWYGEMQVNKERFNEVQQQFSEFNNQV